jgi:hypothetical protein
MFKLVPVNVKLPPDGRVNEIPIAIVLTKSPPILIRAFPSVALIIPLTFAKAVKHLSKICRTAIP